MCVSTDGEAEGDPEGDRLGLELGVSVGLPELTTLGLAEGFDDGSGVGEIDGHPQAIRSL